MALIEPKLHENAIKILTKQKYLWPKADGTTETPKEMFLRVADFVARAELKWNDKFDTERLTEEFYNAMTGLEFVPNSPTLVNASKPGGQLAACFVLPIDDSTDSIYTTLRAAAKVQTSGGGTGFSGARLRSKGSLVGSTGKASGGNIPVIRLFNDSSRDFITQGSARKGANMWVLPVWHADVEEFIVCKDKDGDITEFNISVGASDAFMVAVQNDEMWSLVDPKDGRVTKRLRAKELFEKIVEHAWISGDPGLVFLDAMNRANPTPHIGQYEATNPCGEQPLLPYEACTLGHINLGRMVTDGSVDWNRIGELTKLAVRFLDNVVELNAYPLPEIEKMHRDGNRKIGVGVMGWADMLAQLEIEYDSAEARRLAGQIAAHIESRAIAASENLAQERGAFNNWMGSIFEKANLPKRRNACLMTVAPTGTTGIVAGASTGVEPFFGLLIVRNQAGMTLEELHPLFGRWLTKNLDVNQGSAVIDHLRQYGTIKNAPHLTASQQALWAQANDVSYEGHVLMQAAWQTHVDSAISKTINMANSATVNDVRNAYLLAWQKGCKGITIYRDGSKGSQVLSQASTAKTIAVVPAMQTADEILSNLRQQPKEHVEKALSDLGYEATKEVELVPMPTKDRHHVTHGAARKIPTGCGNAFVFIGNGPDGKIDDVMGRLGKSGGCASAWWEAICRVTSLALRHGVAEDELRQQLSGISCHLPARYTDSPYRQPGEKPRQITSCADALSVALMEHALERGQQPAPVKTDDIVAAPAPVYSVSSTVPMPMKVEYVQSANHAGACPSCGGSHLDRGSGCLVCVNCGFSRC